MKRKALKSKLQTGKRNGSRTNVDGRENSVLAPIAKWKNIVLANEKSVIQRSRKSAEKNESRPNDVSKLFHDEQNGAGQECNRNRTHQ